MSVCLRWGEREGGKQEINTGANKEKEVLKLRRKIGRVSERFLSTSNPNQTKPLRRTGSSDAPDSNDALKNTMTYIINF